MELFVNAPIESSKKDPRMKSNGRSVKRASHRKPVRLDSLTNKRFTFFADPDDLPLELYESV